MENHEKKVQEPLKNSFISEEDLKMEEDFRAGIHESIEEVWASGNPVVKYDFEAEKPYLLYPNGEKKYAY